MVVRNKERLASSESAPISVLSKYGLGEKAFSEWEKEGIKQLPALVL